MSNPVVNVYVSVQNAPAPATLQKTGAFISQGATNTSVGTKTLLKQKSDLTPILGGSKALTSLVWSGNVVTATTVVPHGLTINDTLPVTIAGEIPAGYNGVFTATITGASTFTYPLAVNPGAQSTAGVYTLEDVSELTAMANTFFAQGSQQGVYVLELGAGNATDGVAVLNAWITANPNVFYSYLVPRFWDGNAAYLAFLAGFESTNSKTYFFTTTTLQNWQAYTAAMKCVEAMIEAPVYGVWPQNALTALSQTGGVASAVTTTNHGVVPGEYFTLAGNAPAGYNGWFLAQPATTGNLLSFQVASALGAETALGELLASQYASAGVPSTEFSHAADFWVTLNYKPSSTNKVTQLNLAYLSGVTPFPTEGNASLLATLNAGNVSVVGTGAQGGISNTLVIGGNLMDGNPFKYWYSVDWAQINTQRNLTAYLINGANNPQAPVDYNQPGINGGQQVLTSTMNSGITNGLVLNPVKVTTLDGSDFAAALVAGTLKGYTIVNADPFASYVAENPNDYAAGIYDGYSIDYTPLRGFQSITINISVSQFAA